MAHHSLLGPTASQHRSIQLGLRGQFMLAAAILLSAACLTLGWFFALQQIESMTGNLYRSGYLLAENLAATSRYGLIVGDREELLRLARGILAVNDVSYVSIFTAEGHPVVALATDAWQRLRDRPDAPVAPINPGLLSLDQRSSPFGEVRVVNGKVVFSQARELTGAHVLRLLLGQDDHLFYIGVPIRAAEPNTRMDSNLQLLFEREIEPVPHENPSSRPLLGLVEVGMSSLPMQEQLRTLLLQAMGITGIILVLTVLLLGFFSYRITTPLKRLADAARSVAEGQFRIDLAPTAAGEIGQLSEVFLHMLDSIRDREIALQEMNHTLEAKVAARTQELMAMNCKLLELDRRKSLFVSVASHEIKTPLTSISCHLDNLLTGVYGTLGTDQAKVIERVQVNIERLNHLLGDLLDLCKIELGQTTVELQPVAPAAAVMHAIESLEPFAARKNILLAAFITPELPLVAADKEKLHQIITNLLHNALKFSQQSSTVKIVAQPATGGVQFSVQDSGCGISPEDTAKIFEPFYRSKQVGLQSNGTGLGLPIAKQLVELHGGCLWVESRPGCGSTFFFTLPAWHPTYAAAGLPQ